ncbi:hypothetical protein M3J09_008788 [Ascochyta lentis]
MLPRPLRQRTSKVFTTDQVALQHHDITSLSKLTASNKSKIRLQGSMQ